MAKRLPPAVTPEQIQERLATFLSDFHKALAEINNGAFPHKTLMKYGLDWNRQQFLRKNYDAFDQELGRARESGASVLAERMVEITSEMDNPGMARVASQNMQWYLERVHRKTYAPSVDINVTQQISISSALNDARSRLTRPVIDLEDVEELENPVNTGLSAIGAPDYESVAPALPDRNGLNIAKIAVDAELDSEEDANREKLSGLPDIFG